MPRHGAVWRLNSSPWGRAGCMAVVTCGALGRHGPFIQVGHGGWVYTQHTYNKLAVGADPVLPSPPLPSGKSGIEHAAAEHLSGNKLAPWLVCSPPPNTKPCQRAVEAEPLHHALLFCLHSCAVQAATR